MRPKSVNDLIAYLLIISIMHTSYIKPGKNALCPTISLVINMETNYEAESHEMDGR